METGVETKESPAIDNIVLTIPTSPGFRGVASLVLGGVGSRLDLPYERMDDLQLAVLSMLDAAAGDEVSIEISADDRRLSVAVGPLRSGAEDDEGLALVLSRLTDGIEPHLWRGDPWLSVFVARTTTQAPESAA